MLPLAAPSRTVAVLLDDPGEASPADCRRDGRRRAKPGIECQRTVTGGTQSCNNWPESDGFKRTCTIAGFTAADGLLL
jgi:hypothetical protein